MSLAARIAFAALSLSSLAAAVACGSPAGDPEQTSSGDGALLRQVCPIGTVPGDCGYDIGLGGKLIYSCSCVPADPPPPPLPKSVAVGDDDNGCLVTPAGEVKCWSGTTLVADAGAGNPPHIGQPTYALTTVALPA